MRGITRNYKASNLVNFYTVNDLFLNGRSNSTVTDRTDKKSNETVAMVLVSIVTEPEYKIYKVSFFNRRRIDDNTSVPLGYK